MSNKPRFLLSGIFIIIYSQLALAVVMAVPPITSLPGTNSNGGTVIDGGSGGSNCPDPDPNGGCPNGGDSNNDGFADAGQYDMSDVYGPQSPTGGNNTNNNNNNTNTTYGTPINPDNGGDGGSSGNGGNNSGGGNTNVPAVYRDSDNDGMNDQDDQCPFMSGRGDRYGGLNGDKGCPVDSDGDDIIDQEDRCPWHMGDAQNFGCPSGESAPDEITTDANQTETSILVAYLPFDGPCQIATADLERVNVRHTPDLEAEIVTAMFPQYGYTVLGQREVNSKIWYLLQDSWVASWVVRQGGDCDVLPSLAIGTLPDMFEVNVGS